MVGRTGPHMCHLVQTAEKNQKKKAMEQYYKDQADILEAPPARRHHAEHMCRRKKSRPSGSTGGNPRCAGKGAE